MFIIIWEYQVKMEHGKEFEELYSANGAWAELFRKDQGYLGTELIRNINHPGRYITIDRWVSPHDYESFLSKWKSEYSKLDAACESMTEQETLLGTWELILSET